MSIENKSFRQAHLIRTEKPRFPGIRQIKPKQPNQEQGKKPGGEIKDSPFLKTTDGDCYSQGCLEGVVE